MKFEKLQQNAEAFESTLDRLAFAARLTDNAHLRNACIMLLAYGSTLLHLDPTNKDAEQFEAARFLDWLGLESTYGENRRDVYTYYFERGE